MENHRGIRKYFKKLDNSHVETYLKKILSGFTLPEVIITTAIVAILGSLALPNYLRQMQKNSPERGGCGNEPITNLNRWIR
jgi:prepilin-type N-terminal cleavage/methylation domain-containing protein